MKRAIYPLYAPTDESRVRPILDALKRKGCPVRDRLEKAGKDDALLLFLSRNVSAEGPEADDFFRLNAGRALVIPVNLDGSTPPEALQSALMARHGLDGAKYGVEELAERVAQAVQGEKKSKLPLVLSLIAAAALLTVGGVILWKNWPKAEPVVVEATAIPTATPTPTATPEPSPTPEPHIDGIDVGLDKIAEIVYIGDTFQYYRVTDGYFVGGGAGEAKSYHEIAYENDDYHIFYSKENGQQIPMGELRDVSYLAYLPNLMHLTFVNVKGTIPDLSGLAWLRDVTIINCDISDIQGLAGSRITDFVYHGTAVTDFSPLNDCPSLSNLTLALWNNGEMDLSNLSPQKIRRLDVTGKVTDLSGFSGCERLREVYLSDTYITDLSFLQKSTLLELHLNDMPRLATLEGLRGIMSLQGLHLDSCDQVTTLDGLQGMSRLKWLDISGSDRLRDISALADCSSLSEIRISGDGPMNYLYDVSVLGKLPLLQSIALFGTNNIGSFDFLKELRIKKNVDLEFCIAGAFDYSGLAAIDSYNHLHANTCGNFAAAAPYLKGKGIKHLMIYDGGLVDLSMLPNVINQLDLCHCLNRDLTGLRKLSLREKLWIRDCPYFTSFDGIEAISHIGEAGSTLWVENCPRLSDWSGIEGKQFQALRLQQVLSLPDFSTLTVQDLTLEQLPEDVLPDLHCLDGLDENGRYNLRFVGMDQITDLSPLFRLYGHKLEVPPQVGEQARGLVEDKHFDECEIVYPEGGWDPNEIEVQLLSLDELTTLPPSILKHVKHITIIGDELVNDDAMNFWSDWGEQNVPAFIEDRATGEQTKIDKPGTWFTDFSKLSVLTGLEDLNLWWQPLTDLEGIQALENLKWLKVQFCPKLTDVSAAFTLQELREINFERCPVASLQGIQNLYDLERLGICNTKITSLEGIEGLTHLCQVRLAGTNITDFSPLAQADFSYAMAQEWQPGVSLALNVMNSHQLPKDAFAFLENVPGFNQLEFPGVSAKLWVDKLANKPVKRLNADDCGFTNESFQAFVEAHPELEEVSISWNQQLTDVSCLLSLGHLRFVEVHARMTQAIASLGNGYGFELNIRDD